MTDPKFAERLQTIMKESPGMLSYGKQLTPVTQASWPITKPEEQSQEPVEQSSNDVPSSSQKTITNGETTKLGEPRSDLDAQVGKVNNEIMGEVGSLLISIGYILSKEGIVPDKFNVAGILTFLNDKFKDVNIPSPTEQTTDVEVVAVEPVETKQEFQPQAFLEARKLLESKYK